MQKFFFVLLSLSFIGCNSEKDELVRDKARTEESNILMVEKIREFNISPGKEQIGKLESPMLIFEEDGKKNFIFYDLGLNQVLITDTSGVVLEAIGQKGAGPKEFRHISSFGLKDTLVIVYDGVLDLIKKFDFHGKLVDSYQGILEDNLWVRSNRLFSIGDTLLFGIQEAEKSATSNHWLSSTIASYDNNGNLLNLIGSYDPSLEGAHILYNFPNVLLGNDGVIYTTHRTSYTVQKFSVRTGERISRFGTKTENFKVSDERPKVTDSREVKNKINLKYSFVGDSFVSKNYFGLYFFNFTEEYWQLRNPNDKENFLHLYDIDDNFLGEIALPFFPLGMDSESRLYLLEDDNPDHPKIGVYEIKI